MSVGMGGPQHRRRRAIAAALVVIVTGAGFAAVGTTPAGAATLPGAPGKPVVTARNGGVTLQWSAPANVGSPPLTGYRVQVNNGSGWTVATPERTATAIAAGGEHTCALLNGGVVKCWGFNQYGQLGVGDTTTRGDAAGEMGDNLPPVALGTGRTALAIAAGIYHTCAILNTRAVKCWGLNQKGQLGLGHTFTRGAAPGQIGDSLPPVALGTGRTALGIAAGGDTTCALLDDHTVKCWGVNDGGQLGLGDNAKRGDDAGEMGANLPAVALGTGRTAVAIATGGNHACALLDNATVKCWGANEAGQLGLGDGEARGDGPNEMGNSLPAVALGTGQTAIAIGVGGGHTCAVLNGGSVKCWGKNQTGQLGLGDGNNRGDHPGEMGDGLPAVALGTGRTASAVKLGEDHACALLDGGRVKCWGNNNRGQLGVGDIRARGDGPNEMGNALPAVSLGTGRTAVAVAAGSVRHSCALLLDGAVKCWGFNTSGKLGLGDTVTRGAGLLGDSLVPIALGTVTSVAVRSAAVRLPRGTYQFRIVALSSAGQSAPSAASAPLVLAAVPAAPTGLVGVPGNQQVTLTWNAPANNGGSPVTNYEVTALTSSGEPVGAFGAPTRFVGSAATTLTFTGLLNGANFKFKVAAINAVGAGATVQLADPVTPH